MRRDTGSKPPDTHPECSALLAELGISPALVAKRCLRLHPEAQVLELAELGADGREHWLTPATAAAWRSLKQAALEDGIALFIVSAFRSQARQAEIVRRKLQAGQSLEEILEVCAPPGYSEHHSGLAVDIGAPGCPLLEREFEDTEAYRWLERRAAEFRFTLSYPAGNAMGYQYEPWHWCFDASERKERRWT